MKFNKQNAPVGTRCLIKHDKNHWTPIHEVTVLEWSKSELYVKLHYDYEGTSDSWNKDIINDGEIVEVLPQKSELRDKGYAAIVTCLTCGKTIYTCSHMLVEFPRLIEPKEL